jgi:hypothetical protein
MNPQLIFWLVSLVLVVLIIFFDRKYSMLRDTSSAAKKPYSYSRVQLGWSARMIDISDEKNPNILFRSQDLGSDNFFLDILSDENGVSIHRFQSVIFNLVFGIWFILKVIHNIDSIADPSAVMPVLTDNNLILIGLSSGTYAALKATENKDTQIPKQNPPPVVTKADSSVS